MRKTFMAVLCAGVLAALGAGSALAGEVKGPPGTPGGGGFTPIEEGVAASNCAFNGLNDLIQGQSEFITQNFGTNIRYAREHGIDVLSLGFPGVGGNFGCNPTGTPPGLEGFSFPG